MVVSVKKARRGGLPACELGFKSVERPKLICPRFPGVAAARIIALRLHSGTFWGDAENSDKSSRAASP